MRKKWEDYYQLLEDFYIQKGNINIPKGYVVSVNGGKYNLYEFILGQRKSYRKMMGLLDSNKVATMTDKRKELLDEISMDWDPMETSWRKFYKYLKDYYTLHGNIYISEHEEIIVDGETIAIGRFLERQRRAYRKRNKEKLTNVSSMDDEHLELLENLGMIWDPLEGLWQRNYFLFKEYYDTYGHLEIPLDYEVEVNGERIRLGAAISGQRKAYRKRMGESDADTYAPMSDKHLELLEELDFVDSIKQRRYCYDFGDGEEYYSKLALSQKAGISMHMFNDYFKKFQGDVYKTIRIAQLNVEFKSNNKIQRDETSENGLELEVNINEEQLAARLQRNRNNVKRDSKLPKIEGKSLHQFCIEHGYNYTVILRNYRLKQSNSELTMEDILPGVVAEYVKTGQCQPTSWIYSKYEGDVLLYHLFLALKLDGPRILLDMCKHYITMEDAIKKDCFRQSSQQTYQYLEPLFQECLDHSYMSNNSNQVQSDVVSYIAELQKKYHLSTEEYQVLATALVKSNKSIREFYIFDVGFEKDVLKRKNKIKKYKLNQKELEDSFFVPFTFEQRVLIGDNRELSQRRNILKELVLNWDLLSVEEKGAGQVAYKLTEEELLYIDKTRQKIAEETQFTKTYGKIDSKKRP